MTKYTVKTLGLHFIKKETLAQHRKIFKVYFVIFQHYARED